MTINEETGEIITDRNAFMRTPFNFERDENSLETGLTCPEATMAQQQFKDDSDINVIVERFGLTGELPQNVRVPLEADFIETTDFQSAMNVVRQAQEAFAEMPANVRAEFANDPALFMNFVANPANRKRAEELGIVNLPAEPEKVPDAPEKGGAVT